MYICKTDKAREELAAKSRTLSQRERAALLMADGTRTRAELLILLQCDDAMVAALVAAGYLQITPSNAAGVATQMPIATPAPAATSVQHTADNFEGKRSLATTRMFLFDITERMFTKRQPDKAQWYRDQLRQARDRESMLDVARDMIGAVAEMAGDERADSLSERIAMLLPPE